MFKDAAARIRESLYGIWARTLRGSETTHGNGSGFMIAPGYIVTNSHVLHQDGDVNAAFHAEFLVIRSPDIGRDAEPTAFVAEDRVRDLALLRIAKPRSERCVALEDGLVAAGTVCGSLGFPLPKVVSTPNGFSLNLIERFQGAYISSLFTEALSGKRITGYEVDREMYRGSSGCPGFVSSGRVIGVQSRVRRDEGSPGAAEAGKTLEISLWIPSVDVIAFGRANGVI